MKKHGLLNSEIEKVLADLGHTDQIMIADAGLPIPKGVQKIDLALKLGSPSFKEVLKLVQDEMMIEKVILATEILGKNSDLHKQLQKEYEVIDYVSHEELKEKSKNVKAIIRTGENTPYANIILQAACLF